MNGEKGTTTTTTTTVTSSALSSTSSSATTDNTSTKPTTNGPAVSATSSALTSRIPTISVLPPKDTNNTSTSTSPTGSTVSATSNTSASTSSTAVSPANNISNASTSANPTTAEPTATNKASTDNNGTKSNISDTDIQVIVPAVVVPCGLLIIGAIVLVVFCVSRKARKNVRERPDGMAIQGKGNNIDGWKQSLGQGKATDGFIIYPGPAAISTARSYKDKKHHVVTDQYSRPYPDTYDDKLKRERKFIKPEDKPGEPADKKSKTNNSGSSSAVSREQVQVQMESNCLKSNGEERTPAVHTRTQSKAEPNTISKQTDYRLQPVPPANTGFEATPQFRRLPQTPQNGEIKDRYQRGIYATIGDTPDLASETPRPNRLPPLTAKQTKVQKEDASEEPKKKRKKKKKKDQMNVETPYEESGETDMRVN